jgi:hypothetical protein
MIRPVITYASETWALKESMKRKFLLTERKILRRIFERTKDRCGKYIENFNKQRIK